MTVADRAKPGLRSALWLPVFDDLADPVAVVRLAAEAEETDWHGLFVWDHLSRRAPVRQVTDPWITLATVAAATERLRLGPMVTPLARRRPTKVARETARLDLLSEGSSSWGRPWAKTASAASCPRPASNSMTGCGGQMLDEALASSPPPGPARRYTTAACITPSTDSGNPAGRDHQAARRTAWAPPKTTAEVKGQTWQSQTRQSW